MTTTPDHLTALEQRLRDGDDTITAQDVTDASNERFEVLRKEAQDRKEEERKREQRKAEAVTKAHAAVDGHGVEDLAVKWAAAYCALNDLLDASEARNAAISTAARPLARAFGSDPKGKDGAAYNGNSAGSFVTLDGTRHLAYRSADIVGRLMHVFARDRGLMASTGPLDTFLAFPRADAVERAAKKLDES